MLPYASVVLHQITFLVLTYSNTPNPRASVRFASVRFAPSRVAPSRRFALVKFALVRFAPVRSASRRSASVRFAERRSAPARFASIGLSAPFYRRDAPTHSEEQKPSSISLI